MPFDVGVRDYLQGKGVSSGDIGYDQNSGNVTVKGQNFYRPELNMAGTTYSNQQNLDNAYGNYTKQPLSTGMINTAGSAAGVTTGAGQGGSSTSGNGQTNQYTNPYTQQIADLMKHLSDGSNAAPPDIYNSPQYAAAKANQDRQSADAVRHANESAAGAGLGHSTIMTDRSQRIQDDSNNYLQTQLVPQIMSQLQAQRQQELANQQNQLHDYMTLGQQADSQHNADRTYDAGRQDASTAATGYYNPSGMTADQINQEIAKNSANYANATPQQQHDLHLRNLELNNLLGKTDSTGSGDYTGGNPNGQVGYRTTSGQTLDNQVSAAVYNHARDSLLDKRYEEKFNQDIKQQGFDNALKIAVQEHQISHDNAQIAISARNAANSERGTTANINNMNADNTRADNAIKLTADQHKFAGDVQSELSQAKSRDDVVGFFNANAGEITKQLGPDAFTKMKNDALAQYDKVTQTDKQTNTSREKALAAAQKDYRWLDPKSDRNALIKEYEGYYQ